MFCIRCKNEIIKDRDKWVTTIDFDRGTITGEVNLHLECWRTQHQEKFQQAFNEKVKQLSPLLKNVFGKLGGLNQNVEIV